MKITIRKLFILLFLAFVTLLNSGCSDSSLNGDVFVVKGNGDVKPLAGGKVYLLPYKNEAEFLYEIANNTYATIIPEISETVKRLSTSALDFAQEQKKNLDKEVALINVKYPTPPKECNELESKYKTITQKSVPITKKHNKLISKYQKEIKVAKSDKNRAIRKVADKIKNRIKKRVTVSINQDGYNIEYTIHNDTPYGIVLKDVFLNYNKIKIDNVRYFSTLYDEYGFDTNMHILPNKSRRFDAILILKKISFNPEWKLLYKTGKLKGVKGTFGELYPLVNQITLKYDLYKISSKRDVNIIIYKKTPVNYTELALKEKSFSSFDKKITKIQQQTVMENKRFKKNDNIKHKIKIKKELKDCQNNYAIFKKDTTNLAEINKKILQLSKVIDALVRPKSVNDKWIATATEAIKVLNTDFGGDFKLPSIDDKYAKLVTHNVANKISEAMQTETSIKGAYSFAKVKNGNYLLISEYNDSFIDGFWIKEITLDKNTKIDLNNNSMIDIPLIEYLSYQVTLACKSCAFEEFKESLKNSLLMRELTPSSSGTEL